MQQDLGGHEGFPWISHLPGTQMVNLPWEIDDLPSYKPPFILGIFHGYVQ